MHIIRNPSFGAILVAAVLVTGACTHAFAEEDCTAQIQAYLKAHSAANTDAAWERAFHARATAAMNENESISSESSYAHDKLLDFFFDKKKHFEENQSAPLTAADKLDIAHWYMLYVNNDWAFPARVGPYLTRSNFDTYMESSSDRTAAAE